jgi:hypothetical protein
VLSLAAVKHSLSFGAELRPNTEGRGGPLTLLARADEVIE